MNDTTGLILKSYSKNTQKQKTKIKEGKGLTPRNVDYHDVQKCLMDMGVELFD